MGMGGMVTQTPKNTRRTDQGETTTTAPTAAVTGKPTILKHIPLV